MLHLRHEHPINNKLHRERFLYTSGICRIADRAMKFTKTEWREERLRERNQLAWATTPICGDVRVKLF